MTTAQVESEVQQGGKFVYFQYCISVIVITFRRSSAIFFIRAGKRRFPKSLPYTLVSLVLGWWGIPWGPVRTVQALATDLRGGKDVTSQVMASLGSGRPVTITIPSKQAAAQMASSSAAQTSSSPMRGVVGDSKYCTSCGRQLSRDAAFCPGCGKAQTSLKPLEPPPAA